MGNGVATAGIEYYLPLFFDDTATVFDYLGAKPPWCCMATWNRPSSASGRTRKTAYRLVQGDPDRPALPPESLFLSTDQFYTRANAACPTVAAPRCARMWPTTRTSRSWATCPWCAAPRTRWPACKAHVRNTQHRVLLLAESDGRRESLLDFCTGQPL
jgi:transcription-repair coupling factor (superfamily II helicase)